MIDKPRKINILDGNPRHYTYRELIDWVEDLQDRVRIISTGFKNLSLIHI